MPRHRLAGHAAFADRPIATVVGVFGATAAMLLLLGGMLAAYYHHRLDALAPNVGRIVRIAASWHPNEATVVISVGVRI